MLTVSASDTAHFAGPTSDFIKREILRVGAAAGEIEAARAFVASAAAYSPRAYEALSPRMRRLVDLLIVAEGHAIDVTQTAPPEAA